MIQRNISSSITWLRRLPRTLSRRDWQILAILFIGLVSCGWLFGIIADEVVEGDTLSYDVAILRWIHQAHSLWLDQAVPILTHLGGVITVAVVALVAFLVAVYYRRRRTALIIGLGVGGAALLNIILKALFQRDRPSLWERLVVEHSYSFPSGHAMASSALAFSIIIALWPTRYRYWALIIGSSYMVMIALTRMYLGVHYPTDIIAGWSVSALWVLLVAAIVRRWSI